MTEPRNRLRAPLAIASFLMMVLPALAPTANAVLISAADCKDKGGDNDNDDICDNNDPDDDNDGAPDNCDPKPVTYQEQDKVHCTVNSIWP